MLSNKLNLTPKTKNASPRTCPPKTKQPAPSPNRPRAIEPEPSRNDRLSAIHAALDDADNYSLILVQAAIGMVNAHHRSPDLPYEALVTDLLAYPGLGENPNLDQVEAIFRRFDSNFRAIEKLAKQGFGKSRALKVLAGAKGGGD